MEKDLPLGKENMSCATGTSGMYSLEIITTRACQNVDSFMSEWHPSATRCTSQWFVVCWVDPMPLHLCVHQQSVRPVKVFPLFGSIVNTHLVLMFWSTCQFGRQKKTEGVNLFKFKPKHLWVKESEFLFQLANSYNKNLLRWIPFDRS